MKMMIEREYGVDFMRLFDLVFDLSQFSNNILGQRNLESQDNYMINAFYSQLENGFRSSNEAEKSKQPLLFDYRDLKCCCKQSSCEDKSDNF